MHQRTPFSSPSARRLLALTSLSASVCLAGCNGDALNLGEDEPADVGSCNVDVSSSGNVFALTQADVDALAGCRELRGSLYVRVPASEQDTFSLAALADLEVVHGSLSLAGPLTSLAGLESLEEVAGLSLQGLRVPDLTPLRSLRRSQRGPGDARRLGIVSIQECDQIRDLSGLENLTTWSSLYLVGLDGLVALDGLQVPPIVDSIEISMTPKLVQANALVPLEDVGGLVLTGTGIERLDKLQLKTADSIFLWQNTALTDLDGFANLALATYLTFAENLALRRIELPGLDDFQSMSITGNPVLQAVPHYELNSGSWPTPSVVEPVILRHSRILFEVGSNPQVASITLPTDFTDFEQVAIYDNTSLTTLDMGYLLRTDDLWIQDNSILDTVSASYLDRVDDLSIKNNPALSVAPFADVQTFTREMSGNLDDLAP